MLKIQKSSIGEGVRKIGTILLVEMYITKHFQKGNMKVSTKNLKVHLFDPGIISITFLKNRSNQNTHTSLADREIVIQQSTVCYDKGTEK